MQFPSRDVLIANMTENVRSVSHERNTKTPLQVIEPAAEALAYETRIQIDDSVQPLVSNSLSDSYSIMNATGSMQQNISSIFNQARSELERRTEQTRMWRLNLNNVFEGVRQQSAQYNNTFRLWAPQFTTINTPNNLLRRENLIRPDLSDTIRFNLNELNVTTSANSQHQIVNTETPENTITGNNGSRLFSRPERPILDRVAALTRNDPPDLIERPNAQRPNINDENAMSEVFSQMPVEARRLLLVMARYIPFVCILLVKSFYDHFGAVFDVLGLLGIFLHTNDTVREQAVKQTQRRKLILMRDAFGIIVIFLFFLPERTNSYYNLLLLRPITQQVSLAYLLYSVVVTDLSLKIITVLIKILITLLPASVIIYKRRGRFYMLIESISQLYRAIAPIQLWFVFLLDTYTGMGKIFGAILSMAYMVPKFLKIVDQIKFLKKSIAIFPKKVRYGSVPTKEHIEKAGEQCAICHEGYDTPVLLDCNHIFCENCIGTWFNTEQTCPICRAKVAEDPVWLGGATSRFIQLF